MFHINKLFPKGIVHFSGIGGIGMSGVAEILHKLGYKIQGSDLSKNNNTTRLNKLGIKTFIGHDKTNVLKVSVLVKSTAIKDGNPEVQYCKEHNIPVITRTEMLAEIMKQKITISISGTHGKTTTTSLIASMFESAKLNPTVINGGIINHKSTNAYLGIGDFLIAEADESDATFIKIPSTIAVITNIDPEHLDFYKSFENLKKAFLDFINNLPFYGFGVLCIDHPEVKKLATKIQDRKVITYGINSSDADVQAFAIEQHAHGTNFKVKINSKLKVGFNLLDSMMLKTPGIHNVQNSLAAIAIALELKFAKQDIINGFKDFTGVKRRFTLTGEVNGVKIFDDYAHHPEEIKASLETAKQVLTNKNRLVAIFQPHRYSRLQNLFSDFTQCFGNADILYIADVYEAGESPIEGINSRKLVEKIQEFDYDKKVYYLKNPNDLAEIIHQHCTVGDLVIFLGAGNITTWANELPAQLNNYYAN